jgi:hypothetical protein
MLRRMEIPSPYGLNAGPPLRSNHSGTNYDAREKYVDAGRSWKLNEDRRRDINPFPVTVVGSIPSPPPVMLVAVSVMSMSSLLVAVTVMPMSSLLVTAVIVSSPAVVTIIAEGRRHVDTADHCG